MSATNVSQFAQAKKHHGQQCVRNNMSSFSRALILIKTTRQATPISSIGPGKRGHIVADKNVFPFARARNI